MKEKASGSRKRRFVRIMQWRILACLVPFLVLLITGVLFWFEGRLDRALSATSLSLGQQSALLAASAVRHSEDFWIGAATLGSHSRGHARRRYRSDGNHQPRE